MGPNLMIDATKAVQYLNEIKDSVVAAFQGQQGGPNERGERVRLRLRGVAASCVRPG